MEQRDAPLDTEGGRRRLNLTASENHNRKMQVSEYSFENSMGAGLGLKKPIRSHRASRVSQGLHSPEPDRTCLKITPWSFFLGRLRANRIRNVQCSSSLPPT